MKNIYVVDALGFIFRNYYAIRNMTNYEGKSTNALFGFARALLKLQRDFDVEHLVAVFDGPNSWTSRRALYPEYKANREEAPADLGYQIGWAKELCALMGISILDVPGVEADDTIGSIAKWGGSQGIHVYICSSDKDLCQFVTTNVKILHTHKDNTILGPKEVQEKFGVSPDQIVDYLAIVGDSSDNVPGIPGFGPKTAAALLAEYKTLENLLDNADKFSGKKKETLTNKQDIALLSKKLVKIDSQIDFPKSETFFKLKGNQEGLISFYEDKGFHSLVKEMTPVKEEVVNYQLVQDVDAFVKVLSKQKEVCFDTETTSLKVLEAELVGLGFSFKSGEAYYVPYSESALQKLKPVFNDPSIGFFAHNAKYDLHILLNYEIEVANLSFDTLLASYTLGAQMRQHSLDTLCLERFGKVKIPISDLIGKGKNQISMKEVSVDKVCHYCCEDVDYTFRLKQELAKEIDKRQLSNILFDIELPLLKVLLKMERKGIYLDVAHLEKMSKEVKIEIEGTSKKIFDMAGEEFNLNSPKQLAEILFNKLSIPAPKKISTSADVLEDLKLNYPIAGLILEYRGLEKLRSTYIDALPNEVNPQTHRVHCTFSQSTAATGRLASHEPNLQNIPVRTELGKEVRAAFRPQKPGYSFLSADYSQIELRLLAHMSEDPHLLEAFERGEDIHESTAAKVFDVMPGLVTKEMRNQAKAVNFGVIYGQQAHGLSQQLGITRKEAQYFIDRYFARFDRIQAFLKAKVAETETTGKAVTITGREREIPEIHSKNQMLKRAAERLAINTPLQGTAADLIKLAMLEVEKCLPRAMILQIHDELLFELPDEEIEKTKPLIREAMESIWSLKVPLVVDIAVGKNWKEC